MLWENSYDHDNSFLESLGVPATNFKQFVQCLDSIAQLGLDPDLFSRNLKMLIFLLITEIKAWSFSGRRQENTFSFPAAQNAEILKGVLVLLQKVRKTFNDSIQNKSGIDLQNCVLTQQSKDHFIRTRQQKQRNVRQAW